MPSAERRPTPAWVYALQILIGALVITTNLLAYGGITALRSVLLLLGLAMLVVGTIGFVRALKSQRKIP
ncbi:hypothetical protein [Naasia aerilata]|uniref:hypothetical protein n=1 Tax=Naasia aerilata TaxID=1162966 RepID=UPI002573B9D5|nr:hypothetical protein [Naasia aerilata]